MIRRLNRIIDKEKVLVVGLMSGTSLDGVDAVLISIDKRQEKSIGIEVHDFITKAYSREVREDILKQCNPQTSSVQQICKYNVKLGQIMAMAVEEVVHKAGFSLSDVDFVSSHGQTIYHDPNNGATLQIGELAVIAAKTGLITVGDFRPSDMAVGGQGAPLVPFTDYLLYTHEKLGRALINIGGISNITILEAGCKDSQVMAYDMGPGNVLIDAITKIGTGGKLLYDKDGKMAESGNVDGEWLNELMCNDPFIHKTPPKSTGREHYTWQLARDIYTKGVKRGLRLEDIIATVTQYTVEAIVYHVHRFIHKHHKIDQLLISGGGSYNPTLMNSLRHALDEEVLTLESIGESSEAKEAISFAILGYYYILGKANNLPSATGARKAVQMGKLVLP